MNAIRRFAKRLKADVSRRQDDDTWLVAVGVGIGLALASGAGQGLSAVFDGLPAAHVPTFAATVGLFLAVGTAASIVPAGQAVREGWRRALHED